MNRSKFLTALAGLTTAPLFAFAHLKQIFRKGDTLFDLAAGDSIFLPRKVPHAWPRYLKQAK